jgi:hypothetical protein
VAAAFRIASKVNLRVTEQHGISQVPVAHQIRLKVIPYSNRFQLRKFVQENTDTAREAIYMDENSNYRGIGDADTRHETVNHSAEQ